MNKSSIFARILALSVFGAAPVCAQSFNIDVGSNNLYPVPSSSYGAGANQAGTWISLAPNVQPPFPLTDINGNVTGVTVTTNGGSAFQYPFGNGTSGDDTLLHNDIQNIPFSSPVVWTISGLVDGDYDIYTYAWAPDNTNYFTTIAVPISPTGAQTIGGAWPGANTLGITFALHTVTISGGNSVTIDAAGVANHSSSINGFQIVEHTDFVPFCYGDGSLATACPCGNFGTAGHGCGNSVSTGGAKLTPSGTVNPDAVDFIVTDVPPGVATIFLQGNLLVANGVIFGDGVRCAGGALVRLGLKNDTDFDGSTSFGPGFGDAQVSVLGGVVPGNAYYYQTYYRNPNAVWCPPATFNISGGVIVNWP